MALYTFSLVILLSSFCLQTGSFNTPITLASFPILLLNYSPSYHPHLSSPPNILHCLHHFQPPVLNFHTTMSSSFFHLHHFYYLLIHFIPHLVIASSNFFKFISFPCRHILSVLWIRQLSGQLFSCNRIQPVKYFFHQSTTN